MRQWCRIIYVELLSVENEARMIFYMSASLAMVISPFSYSSSPCSFNAGLFPPNELPAGKVRLALFEEGARSLLPVLGHQHRHAVAQFDLEGFVLGKHLGLA
jgi:hypothetical protein